MRKQSRRRPEAVSYWETHADLMTALVLVVLLFLMLLLLNLFGLEEAKPDEYDGVDDIGIHDYVDYLNQDHGDDGAYEEPETETHEYDDEGGGDGGDGTYDEEPLPQMPPGIGKDAVLVQLIDEGTEHIIRKEDVSFELFTEEGYKLFLQVYYPQLVEYKTYETTAKGTFYLPEKIWPGTYFFHALTAPEGYDLPEDVSFTILDEHDWDDPYVVQIPLAPCRNTIELRQIDGDDGGRVPGGSYDVYAAEDIITLDGTTRYRKGEKVSSILCREDGTGSSDKELYLGEYLLRQREIPEYYAGFTEDIPVTVAGKTEETEPLEILCRRSRITVHLSDDAEENVPIADAVYLLTCEEEPGIGREYKTNYMGELVLEELSRNRNYHLVQQDGPWHDVITDNVDHVIRVDDLGLTNGEAQPVLELTNRILRIRIDLVSAVARLHINGRELTLYDSEGAVVESWNTGVGAMELSGMDPGDYYVTDSTQPDRKELIRVRDVSGVQKYTIRTRDMREIVILGILAALLLALPVVLMIMHIRRKRKLRKESEEHGPTESGRR